jgi:hypothetical protein
MPTKLDFLCDALERDFPNVEIQIRHIGCMFRLLRVERKLPQFSRAFEIIEKAMKANPDNIQTIPEVHSSIDI